MEVPAVEIPTRPIVTSGESDGGDSSDDDDDDDDAGNLLNGVAPHTNATSASNQDELYDENLDDEDEAYVYKNLRSGTLESIQVRRNVNNSNSGKNGDDHQQRQMQLQQRQQHLKALRPRHSDAVLSCPCCFNIVCMDSQRHEKYPDQFRAMFVMGIAVKWDQKLRYDSSAQGLVPFDSSSSGGRGDAQQQQQQQEPGAAVPPLSNVVPPDPAASSSTSSSDHHAASSELRSSRRADGNGGGAGNGGGGGGGPEYYYAVCCANCDTQVAALDMTDEVYHFYGCLASS